MAKRLVKLDTKEIDVLIGSCTDPKLVAKLERSKKGIKRATAKAKGMNFQRDIAMLISEITGIPFEKDGLIESRTSGCNGTDICLRGEAKKLFPFSVECKAVENLNLVEAINQAKDNKQEGTDWLLVHRRKALENDVVIMDIDAFVALFLPTAP